MSKFLLVVFDGLRPDMVTPANTPNLMRFAAQATRFTRARSVFPSETRVCSATVTTGCLPRRHGLVANRIADPRDPAGSIDTGHMQNLRALEQATGQPLLDAPTLAEICANSGKTFAVFSSGTTGQTYVLNPRADQLGQITLSAHGPEFCSANGRELLAKLPEIPLKPTDRAVWLTDAFRTHILQDPPDISFLWLCEPDISAHYAGLGSPANRAALTAVDAAFGRLIDAWQSGPMAETLHIAVASDHGHATVIGHHTILKSLENSPASGLIPMGGSSCALAAPPERIADVAEWLTRQPWVGSLYATDNIDLPPGVLPASTLLADHPRAAPLLFTLRGSNSASPLGLPGTTLYDGALPIGGGTHGGLLAAEMHILLMFGGSQFQRAQLSEWPAGLTDIAPTALALLNIPAAAAMDGRILTEAFHTAAEPDAAPSAETWEAAGPHYAQRLARTRLGRHIYIDAGQRE